MDKTITTIEKDGHYLMENGAGFLAWTQEWGNACTYANRKTAISDINYMGISMAQAVTYDLVPSVPVVQKQEEPAFVYIVVERHDDYLQPAHCKIGYSKDPEARLKQLQTGHPIRLGLEGWFYTPNENTAREEERKLHATFAHLRLRNNAEWFVFNDELKDFILESHKHNEAFTRFFS